jgi:hypothetical protein
VTIALFVLKLSLFPAKKCVSTFKWREKGREYLRLKLEGNDEKTEKNVLTKKREEICISLL